jgi:hypothetical protein
MIIGFRRRNAHSLAVSISPAAERPGRGRGGGPPLNFRRRLTAKVSVMVGT